MKPTKIAMSMLVALLTVWALWYVFWTDEKGKIDITYKAFGIVSFVVGVSFTNLIWCMLAKEKKTGYICLLCQKDMDSDEIPTLGDPK